MKTALIIVALAIVALLLAFALQNRDLSRVERPAASPSEGIAPGAPPPTPAAGFEQVVSLLQADARKVSVPLDAPRQTPANAFRIKERLRGKAEAHEEYRVLERVCDLLIFADQQRALRARACAAEQGKLYLSPLEANQKDSGNKALRDAIHRRAEQDWEAERVQTANEVKRLFSLLQGKKL